MTRHGLRDDGPFTTIRGSVVEYWCLCGAHHEKRSVIEQHVADCSRAENRSADATPVDDEDFGGRTEAHYLPVEPRRPAPSIPPMFGDADTSAPHLPPPPENPRDVYCQLCGTGRVVANLPEILAWSCGHWIRKQPPSVAEAFQEMLRGAYRAGTAAAASGEAFETWYAREVLR